MSTSPPLLPSYPPSQPLPTPSDLLSLSFPPTLYQLGLQPTWSTSLERLYWSVDPRAWDLLWEADRVDKEHFSAYRRGRRRGTESEEEEEWNFFVQTIQKYGIYGYLARCLDDLCWYPLSSLLLAWTSIERDRKLLGLAKGRERYLAYHRRRMCEDEDPDAVVEDEYIIQQLPPTPCAEGRSIGSPGSVWPFKPRIPRPSSPPPAPPPEFLAFLAAQ